MTTPDLIIFLRQFAANDFVCEPGSVCAQVLLEAARQIQSAAVEFSQIDAALARRPALDGLPGRVEKIERALAFARRSEELESALAAEKEYGQLVHDFMGQWNPDNDLLSVLEAVKQQRAIETSLRAQIVALQNEAETMRMQAAAVMTATIQNTDATTKDRIGRDNPYWTQAYADVCAAVDREIALRKDRDNCLWSLKRMTKELADTKQALLDSRQA